MQMSPAKESMGFGLPPQPSTKEFSYTPAPFFQFGFRWLKVVLHITLKEKDTSGACAENTHTLLISVFSSKWSQTHMKTACLLMFLFYSPRVALECFCVLQNVISAEISSNHHCALKWSVDAQRRLHNHLWRLDFFTSQSGRKKRKSGRQKNKKRQAIITLNSSDQQTKDPIASKVCHKIWRPVLHELMLILINGSSGEHCTTTDSKETATASAGCKTSQGITGKCLFKKKAEKCCVCTEDTAASICETWCFLMSGKAEFRTTPFWLM